MHRKWLAMLLFVFLGTIFVSSGIVEAGGNKCSLPPSLNVYYSKGQLSTNAQVICKSVVKKIEILVTFHKWVDGNRNEICVFADHVDNASTIQRTPYCSAPAGKYQTKMIVIWTQNNGNVFMKEIWSAITTVP